jgi:hypothetical protein
LQRLLDARNSNPFIRNSVATMENGVPSEHAKTLSTFFVIEQVSKKQDVASIYRDRMEEIMECASHTTPLHLKIAAWHDVNARDELAMPLDISEFKTILRLMPRQELLRDWIRRASSRYHWR